MTDKEEQHPRSPRKHGHSNRGRPGQSRIYHHLGVRDLREIIDRKRVEKGVNEPVPPKDPSYNYLKDPLRETAEHDGEPRQNPRRSNRREREPKSSPSHQQKDIENPLNIKVEFSTSTGQHSYQLDGNTVLPTIKHVPDHTPGYTRPFRGRGRGRGRGRNYYSRTIRNTRQGQAPGGEQLAEVTPNDVEANWDLEENERKEVSNEQEAPQNEEVTLEQSIGDLKLEDDKDKIEETKE